MRICVLTHNLKDDNGGGVFSRRLVEGLQKELGAEVVALTAVGNNLPFEQPILYPNKLKLITALPRIRRIIKKCDVVHALDAYPYGIVAATATRGLNKKIILTAVGTGSIHALYNYSWPMTSLVRWSYGQASAVTAISRFTRDVILARLPNLAITVINPGIDPHEATVASREHVVTDSLGHHHALRDLSPYIVSVGALRWRKGYHLSIRAFAKVVKEFPKLKYIIVGKQYGRRYYHKMQYHIRRLGLEGKVFICDSIDRRDDLTAIYEGAELFCLFPLAEGYDVEGFGIVFLEAAAAGLPIVTARNGGVEDAVREGENAFIADATGVSAYNDPNLRDPFSDAVQRILRDRGLKKRMSEASRAFAQESFWDKRMQEYKAMYGGVIQ